jgi:catechol-2,3-dioxygenase
MNTPFSPNLSHFGMFCRDIEKMASFYGTVFNMVETDRGVGRTFTMTLVFMSGNPEQHHQLVLASGRPADAPSTVMQLSFKVQAIDDLRRIQADALAAGATKMRRMNHGNALSIYFEDIEGNTIEVYLDTPWYVPQPHGDPLDLSKSDAEIWAETEAACRKDPAFEPAKDWAASFDARPSKFRDSEGSPS